MNGTSLAWLLFWLALLGNGAALGQSQGAENSPEAVARAFVEAKLDNDRERLLPLLTKKAREFFSQAEMPGKIGGEVSIGQVSVQGDAAEAAVTVVREGRTENSSVLMKTEDGRWRVYGIKMGPLTISFETVESELQAIGESFAEHLRESFKSAFDEAFSNPPEDPSSLDLKQRFAKRYENGQDLSSMTALDALDRLSKELGLRVDAGIYADWLRAAVAADVKGLQKLEAIERIARRFGLHPVYPSPQSVAKLAAQQGTAQQAQEIQQQPGSDVVTIGWPEDPSEGAITFQPGQRAYPVAFGGPFLISLEKVEEHVPYATGRIHLRVRAYGLDPLVSRLFSQLNESIEIESVEDEQGGNLLKEPNMRYLVGQSQEGTAYQNAFQLDLVGLLQDVEQIALIKGAQPLMLPAETVAVEFSDLDAGQEQRSGPFSVTLTSSGQKTEFEVRGPAEQIGNLFVDFAARDSQGQGLSIEDRSQRKLGESALEASLTASSLPSSILLKLVRTAIVKYPFEWRGIELKRHADMPKNLAPLSFQGAMPVDVEFVRFTSENKQRALLRFHNRSNKDVLSISAERIAVDSQGADLDRTVLHHHSSGQGVQRLVGARGIEEKEEWVFSPQESSELQFQVKRVEFMDGTRWERP